MPLAASLATERVFQAFLGPSKLDALLHGHSYAGNPIGCAVACEALDIYQASPALALMPAAQTAAQPQAEPCHSPSKLVQDLSPPAWVCCLALRCSLQGPVHLPGQSAAAQTSSSVRCAA